MSANRFAKERGRIQDTDSFVASPANPTSPRAKRHRDRLLSAESSNSDHVEKKRGRRLVLNEDVNHTPVDQRNRDSTPVSVPKKRGRRTKAELEKIARMGEEETLTTSAAGSRTPEPSARKRKKPEQNSGKNTAATRASEPPAVLEEPKSSKRLSKTSQKIFNDGIVPMHAIFHPNPAGKQEIDEVLEKCKEFYHEVKADFDARVRDELDNEFSAWLMDDPLEMEALLPDDSMFKFYVPKEGITYQEVYIGDEKNNERALKSGKKCGGDKNLKRIPCVRIESGDITPDMMYYVPIQSSIDGREQPRLTHLPFFSDDQNDLGLFAQLIGLFPDGIHGFASNYDHVNDYLLYSVMRKALEMKLDNPDLVYYGIYLLWPNKLSQRELTDQFANLAARFAEPGFDSYALETWKAPPAQEVAPNRKSIKCYACLCFICSQHGFRAEIPKKFPSGQYYKVKIPIHQQSTSDLVDEYCSESCWKHVPLEKVTEILKPDESEMEKLTVHAYMCKKKIVHAPIEESSYLARLFVEEQSKEETFCQFVARTLYEPATGPDVKSCRAAYEFLIDFVERPSAGKMSIINKGFVKQNNFKSRFDAFRSTMHNNEKHRKQMALEKLKQQAVKDGLDVKKVLAEREEQLEKEGAVLEAITPITSCDHDGPCNTEQCACYRNGMCSILCDCDINCSQRFPGCVCAPGQCGSRACQCYRARWECSPLTCKTCDCDKIDAKGNHCQNYSMTRQKHKQVVVAPSRVAGNGLFLLQSCEKDEFIIEYVGERISDEEAERRGAIYDRYNCSYIFNLETGGAIDSFLVGNLSRFANHSDKKSATMYARTMVVAGEHRIGFYASRDLEANEELTFNYSYSGEHQKIFKDVTEVPKSLKVRKKTSS